MTLDARRCSTRKAPISLCNGARVVVGGAHKLWLRSRTLSSRYERKMVANFKLKHNILCLLVVVVVVVVDAVVAIFLRTLEFKKVSCLGDFSLFYNCFLLRYFTSTLMVSLAPQKTKSCFMNFFILVEKYFSLLLSSNKSFSLLILVSIYSVLLCFPKRFVFTFYATFCFKLSSYSPLIFLRIWL